MAFRKKADFLLQYKPDILVIPECEHPDKLKYTSKEINFKHSLWFGTNANKGLGIFCTGDFKIKKIRKYNPDYKIIIPLAVESPKIKFVLYAVWANNPLDSDGQYVTQVWKAIHHYDKLLDSKLSILAGDFNSNTIWDKPRREGNHSTLVKKLAEKGIDSAYHSFLKQEQGKEAHPTLYMYRQKNKPYHIDYCFASKKIIDSIRSVEVGDHERWCRYSDHVPLIVDFDI
jgi:exodeoxyribonuclease III